MSESEKKEILINDHLGRVVVQGEYGSVKEAIEAHRSDLRWANLGGADLRGANLDEANLRGAFLEGANLGCASLRFANLRMANLHLANLDWADLSGADFRLADFRNADLNGANLSGAKLDFRSHDVVAQILKRGAGADVEKRKVAGLILVSQDWCWANFLAIDSPLREWALSELAKHVVADDGAPAILRRLALAAKEATDVNVAG